MGLLAVDHHSGKIIMFRSITATIISMLGLAGCSRLGSIPYHPEQTPDSWLSMQPYTQVNIGPVNFILVQPSSTFLVYLLGIITIAAGFYCLRIQAQQRSRQWWGIALILWGLGAILAGTSYQAFSYEIKCAGREMCSWTSWWEIFYLVLSAGSVNAMFIAGAYSCSAGKWRKVMISYAVINFGVYLLAVVVGIYTLNKFLIAFELLLIFSTPIILLLFILNSWRYFKFRQNMDLVLLITWLWLGFTIAAYFLYWALDITHKLWEQSIWFSENDVLHIGLIIWMIYIAFFVVKHIVDVSLTSSASSSS
jgi:hypothetical protein